MKKSQSASLPRKILVGLGLGAAVGVLLNPWSQDPALGWVLTHVLGPMGQAFLRLLLMAVVPLLVSGLILGVAELGQARQGRLSRVVRRTIGYTLLTSTISVGIGVGLTNWISPGLWTGGLDRSAWVNGTQPQSEQAQQVKAQVNKAKPVSQILVELIPKNPIEAASRALDGDIVALMVFAMLFGLAWSRVDSNQQSPLRQVLERIFDASMKLVHWALNLAPWGVFALVATTVVRLGPGVFVALGAYVATVVLGLALQQYGTYGLLLKGIARVSPAEFFRKTRDVLSLAFATASSNATLPKSIEVAQTELKLSRDVSRFVLTVGSSANQNGTALFEGVTVLFLAQFFGIDLSIGAQVTVVAMSILAGVGTAGVPGGSLPLVMILLDQVGVPPEGIGIVLGVDRFLDMCRTAVNVSGDLVVATLVDRSTGAGRNAQA